MALRDSSVSRAASAATRKNGNCGNTACNHNAEDPAIFAKLAVSTPNSENTKNSHDSISGGRRRTQEVDPRKRRR